MRLSILLALFCVFLPLLALAADVPQWQPQDFSFRADVGANNPFQVAFSADLTGPGGIKLTIPGFYDGNGTWKIRVSPTTEGQWTLVTHGASPALDNQRATFNCVANTSPMIHGALRIDSERPSQFLFEDGSRFFTSGYECDWLWALDMNDPELKTLNPFLDKLAAYGFNYIVLDAYAYDTSWRKGHTAGDDFGPPPLYAWEGSNDKPDFRRFNLAYWEHFDRMIDALQHRGIVAHILMKVYNKQVNWPAYGSPEDDMYYLWLLARYSAYPNVTWDLAKEAQYVKDVNQKINRLRFIRANDPYKRLLTVHDDHDIYNKGKYNELVDYRSDQQHKDWRQVMFDHLHQRPWPVINTEYGYEHGPKGINDKTYSVAQEPEEVCRRAWEICTAGGFGVYYYTYTAWDVVRTQETPPGYAYYKHLRDFWEGTEYWKMTPVEDVTSDGYCMADPGKEYVVFQNAAAPFTINLELLEMPLKAQWFNPYSGERADAGQLKNGTYHLTPPAQWGNGPIALHGGRLAGHELSGTRAK